MGEVVPNKTIAARHEIGKYMALLDQGYGNFLPETDTFDRSIIDNLNVDKDLKESMIRLYQLANEICVTVNKKDTGLYIEEEFVNGQQWFQNKNLSSTTAQRPEYRQVFRKVFNMGALPTAAGSPTVINHGITFDSNTTFTRIYGTATNTTGFAAIPLPYVHATATSTIRLDVSATQVIITSGGLNYSAYDTTYVVLEYIRN